MLPLRRRWTDLENNPALQQYANYGLGAAYGLIALVALVRARARSQQQRTWQLRAAAAFA